MKRSYLESILILTLIGSSVALATTNSSQSTNNTLDISVREGRRSNIAESCQTTEDAGGTCMSRFKCMSSGGSPKGFCGSYSVCCESKRQNKSNYPLTQLVIVMLLYSFSQSPVSWCFQIETYDYQKSRHFYHGPLYISHTSLQLKCLSVAD